MCFHAAAPTATDAGQRRKPSARTTFLGSCGVLMDQPAEYVSDDGLRATPSSATPQAPPTVPEAGTRSPPPTPAARAANVVAPISAAAHATRAAAPPFRHPPRQPPTCRQRFASNAAAPNRAKRTARPYRRTPPTPALPPPPAQETPSRKTRPSPSTKRWNTIFDPTATSALSDGLDAA